MRATINFEIDIDKVEETMGTLVAQEAMSLRHAATILENIGNTTLLEEISEAIDLVHAAGHQLHQYRSMIISFERAKFDTVLPQHASTPAVNVASPSPVGTPIVESAQTLQKAVESIQAFEGFVGKMNAQPGEEEDVKQSKEG